MQEKNKAEQLINLFRPHISSWNYYNNIDDSVNQLEKAKQCALGCVYEIRKSLKDAPDEYFAVKNVYWNKVKKEIEIYKP